MFIYFDLRHKPYGFHQRRSHMSEDTWGQRPALCLAAGKGCPISPIIFTLYIIASLHHTISLSSLHLHIIASLHHTISTSSLNLQITASARDRCRQMGALGLHIRTSLPACTHKSRQCLCSKLHNFPILSLGRSCYSLACFTCCREWDRISKWADGRPDTIIQIW